MRKPAEDRMQKYWDERARLNAAWYVDTSLNFDAPDMDRFFEEGESLVAQALDRFPANPTGHDRVALEIGAGLGRLCRALKNSFGRVIGVDISPEMVERARTLVPECEFQVNDGSTLNGIDDQSIDFVLTFTVFQHIPDPDLIHAYVREIGRVLKPGGSAYLQWNGSTNPAIWSMRRRVSGVLYKAGLRSGARETAAPEFLGSCVKPTVMNRWLSDSGLVIATSETLGSLWSQAWVIKAGAVT